MFINLPDIGVKEAEVTEILIKEGEKIIIDQPLITIESDKALMQIPSTVLATVTKLIVKIGDKIKPGDPIIRVNINNNNELNNKENNELNNQENKEKNISVINASPATRRIVRKLGISLENIKGTGRKGRVLQEDIDKYIEIEKEKNNEKEKKENKIENKIKNNTENNEETEIIELSHIKKISNENLFASWSNIPHVTQHDEADITELENFRTKQNTIFKSKNRDIKITSLTFLLKAVAKALKKFPYFNSSLYKTKKQLLLKKYYNIGIAVETYNGLVVPVIKNVNNKNIIDLSIELVEIVNKARNLKLTFSDMQNGCFTISNIGNIGGTFFTPIINAPEVAILGIGKAVKKPVWDGNKFIPRIMLPLSLSYDHRVIDGANGARFIIYISKLITDIRLLLL